VIVIKKNTLRNIILVGIICAALIGAFYLQNKKANDSTPYMDQNNSSNSGKTQPADEDNTQTVEEGRFETKASYEIKDGVLIFDIELTNRYNEPKELEFSSGQQFEIVVTDGTGNEVYRYSDDKFFTLALITKTVEPGETLTWVVVEWEMTDKSGEKLAPGNYKAEITVLASFPGENGEDSSEQFRTVIDINLTEADLPENAGQDEQKVYNEEGIISPEYAEKVISEISDNVIQAIRDKDFELVSEFVHPVKGVRFTPYTYVEPDRDVVFSKEEIKKFFENTEQILWGYYDGSGFDILLTPAEYYERFIYSRDFANAEQVGYNEVLSYGNAIVNHFEVYEDPIVVEYYFAGSNPEYDGLDWRSLSLVFEEYEGSWKLVGIINNEWTI